MEKKRYTKDEVYEASLAYFNGDKSASQSWMEKYAAKDAEGNFYEITPTERLWQLSNEIARIERHYHGAISAQEIFNLFDHFRYLIIQEELSIQWEKDANTPLFRNYVLGNNSGSCESILKTEEEQLWLMKRGANVGHDLSAIHPDIFYQNGLSQRLPYFMKRYIGNLPCKKSLLSMSLSIKHPEVDLFVGAKSDEENLLHCGTTLKIDDDFMRAALENRSYQQQYADASTGESKNIEAKALWNKILHQIWQTANLKICFWDTVQKEAIPGCYPDFTEESSDPWSDMPLCAYDSSRLISINLYSYVVQPFSENAHFDVELFRKHIALAQRFMDDMIDLEVERIDAILASLKTSSQEEDFKQAEQRLWTKIRQKAVQGRRIGVGVTGEADMLAAMNLSYGSDKASDFAEKLHKMMAITVYRSSIELAKERGSFEGFNFKKEENTPFINRLFEAAPEIRESMQLYGRRNVACINLAPLGSMALMAQSSSGIEPAFSLVYKSVPTNEMTQEDALSFHPAFKTWMEKQGYNADKAYDTDALRTLIAQSPYANASSREVDWLQKIKLQGRLQKWTDQMVKSSIYLPAEADEEQINLLYMEAWRLGCKSCCVYREGAGVSTDAHNREEKKAISDQAFTPIRPKEMEADVLRFQNNKEKWIAFIGLQNNRPYEIFTGIQDDDDGIALPKNVTHGKIIKNMDENGMKRYDFQFSNRRGYKTTVEGLSDKFNPEYWNYAKLISGVLRYGMPIDQVVKLVGSLELDNKSINTWKNGVERALKNYLPGEGTIEELEKEDSDKESILS